MAKFGTKPPVPEHSSLEAATRLADRIRSFWAARGFAVRTTVESVPGSTDNFFQVRSDMIDGLPSRYAA